MSINYRTTVNVEWTSKCNALCAMCPREMIEHPHIMTAETWQQTLARIAPEEVVRVVIAGYGEPTTHPRFFDMGRWRAPPPGALRHGEQRPPARRGQAPPSRRRARPAADFLFQHRPGCLRQGARQPRPGAGDGQHQGCKETAQAYGAGHQPDPDAGMPARPARHHRLAACGRHRAADHVADAVQPRRQPDRAPAGHPQAARADQGTRPPVAGNPLHSERDRSPAAMAQQQLQVHPRATSMSSSRPPASTCIATTTSATSTPSGM
jgi:hypothetical protein